jgi:hypothetical protein
MSIIKYCVPRIPPGERNIGRVIRILFPMTTAVTVFFQRTEVAVLTGYGPSAFGNRPVRTRMPGGVGAGGENPPATRLGSGKPFGYFR